MRKVCGRPHRLSAHADRASYFPARSMVRVNSPARSRPQRGSNAPTLLCDVSKGMPVIQQNIAPLITGIAIERVRFRYFGGSLHFTRLGSTSSFARHERTSHA